MAVERTFGIVKPNAVADNNIGNIISRYEKEGLRIAAMRMTRLTTTDAEGFYAEHKGRPFFESLVHFMTSDIVVLVVLEGENAIMKNRDVMGATNPANAAPGTLRKLFAKSLEANAVHGSDSAISAKREIEFFFKPNEIFTRF